MPISNKIRHAFESLSKEPGLLGVIFRKSQNKIQDPAKLERLIRLIDGDSKDKDRILWMGMYIDVKGEIYEGLLEKNAEDVKSGAGQYFTPRALISAINIDFKLSVIVSFPPTNSFASAIFTTASSTSFVLVYRPRDNPD